MRTNEVKQESSIPTAARVDLITLAELARWWEDTGYRIKTVSQLISWSLDLLRSTLKANGKLDANEFTVAGANEFLARKGLYQRSVRARATEKISTALRFESLREEGVDPKNYVPSQYSMIHKSTSVQPIPEEVGVKEVSEFEADWVKAKIENQREEIERRRISRELAINAARQSGTLRDAEIVAKENAPLDMELLKSQTVKVPKDE